MPTIQFPSPEARTAYWEHHCPPGGPSEPQDEFIDYIESRLPGEHWDAFTHRVRAVRQGYERAGDLTMAVYALEKFNLGPGGDNLRAGFDQLLARAAPAWRASEGSPGLDAWLRWCQLAAIFRFIPTGTDERTADFLWAKVRCFVAGAGFAHHAAIADELSALYPGCPFRAEDTEEEWREALLKAHAASGWPAHLSWITWTKLAALLGTGEEEGSPLWIRMLALLHVLKHTRVSESQGVVVHFAGVSTILPDERINAIGTWNSAKAALLSALGASRQGGRKKVPVVSAAVSSVLAHLEVNHLLRKDPIAALPANLLAGPWTMAVPCQEAMEGFLQTGLRMSGLWSAKGGKISRDHLDQPDVLRYDFNVLNPAAHADSRRVFQSGLPSTYVAAWPSEVFHDAFPNLDLSWAGSDEQAAAIKTLLDVPVAASLLRSSHPELRSEYPAVVFMPATPSPNDSTNQGKSQATLTYARACNPAITRLVSINDSSSAPDIRTVAGEIRSTGSIAIDEFRPPKNATHIFAHDNFQALCTGSGVASGRVYENEGTVSLRCSPILSAKVYEVPPDIQNRSLAHWLGPLTDAMRTRTDTLEGIRTGALALRMRLGMHAVIESTGLLAAYESAGRQSSARGLRFDAHRTLAACILSARTALSRAECYDLLDTVVERMQNRMRSHVQLAVDTGLVAAMEFGTALKLRATYLFDDMSADEFTRFRQTLSSLATQRDGGIAKGSTPKEVLLAWGMVHNMENHPFQGYLQVLTGYKRNVSNRAVTQALGTSLHELTPTEGARWFLPGELGTVFGWYMERGKGDYVHFRTDHPGVR